MSRRHLLASSATAVALMLAASSALGGGYVVATAGGVGGESRAGSLGVEGGWMGLGLLAGLGMGIVFTGSDWEAAWDNPLATVDTKRNHDFEGCGALGWAVARRWRLLATAGASFESHSSRTSFNQGTPVEWDPHFERGRVAWSGQLQFEQGRLVIGGGYHNRRGGIGRLGFGF